MALGIILPAECNLLAIEGHEAVVGDGDAVSVAGEIAEDMMGTAEGWFGIDDPVLAEQGAQESAEGFLVLQRSKRAREDDLALLESSLESGDELTAKDATEHAHRQEEGIARVDPARVVGRKTSGGNQTMQVRMEQQVLTPTVQHGKEADLSAEMFGIRRNLEQGLGGGVEQKIVEDLLVDQGQTPEMMRDREDDVNIRDRQQFALPGSNPTVARPTLTLGAMAIATTIKGEGAIAAARTLVTMSAQCRGATACDGQEHFAMAPVNPAATGADKAIALCANDIGHLQRWPSHFFCSLSEGWTSSTLASCRLSRGLGTACKCFWDRCR